MKYNTRANKQGQSNCIFTSSDICTQRVKCACIQEKVKNKNQYGRGKDFRPITLVRAPKGVHFLTI